MGGLLLREVAGITDYFADARGHGGEAGETAARLSSLGGAAGAGAAGGGRTGSPDFLDPRAHLVINNNESTLMICCFLETAAGNPAFFPPEIMLRIFSTPELSLSMSSFESTLVESSIAILPEHFSVPSPEGPDAENVMSSIENF